MKVAPNLPSPDAATHLFKMERHFWASGRNRQYSLARQPLCLLILLANLGVISSSAAPQHTTESADTRLALRGVTPPRAPRAISIPISKTAIAPPLLTMRRPAGLGSRIARKRGPGLAKELLVDRIITPAQARVTDPKAMWRIVPLPPASAPLTPGGNSIKAVIAATPPVMRKTAPPDIALAQLPPAQQVPVSLPPLPSLGGQPLGNKPLNGKPVAGKPVAGKLPSGLPLMRKVIAVASLSPAPPTQPLPEYFRNKAVSADGPFLSPASLPLPAGQSRLTQNPNLSPLREPARPVTSSDRLPNVITVATSTFVVLLTTTDLQTVAVADPAIADVSVVNSRAVLVNGKTAGVTSLVIIDRLKIRQYQVRVTAPYGKSLSDVTNAIGLPGVTARMAGESVIIEGEVSSAEEKKRAEDIAGAFSGKIINLLTVPAAPVVPGLDLATQIQNAINLPNVKVLLLGETLLIEGTVDNAQQLQRAEAIAKTSDKKVANLLQLPSLTLDQVRDSIGAVTGAAGATDVLDTAARITVRQAGDQIILDGRAANAAQSEQAALVAGRSGLRVINNLQLAPAASAEFTALRTIEATINRAVPGAAVTISGTPKRLIMTGTVPDTNAAVAAEQIARASAAEVDNMLRTPNPRIVDVDVSIVEINRNGLRNLGFIFPSLSDNSGTGFVVGQRSQNPVGPDSPGPVGNISRAVQAVSAFQAQLRAVVESGSARLLSNPHTTVLSSRTATFQVGGQVPVPVSITQTATGTTTGIEFKDFGVLVDVIPNATEDGVVTMRLRTEVSQPDYAIGFTPFPGASKIPGFSRRSTVTEVTVQPNGTIALGGLIQNSVTELTTSIPLLSRLPILGSLFKSKRFQRNETELVIFVTPRVLPNTLTPGQLAPAGVVAAGNTTNVATKLGNPGISSFDSGRSVGTGSGGGGAAP